MKEREKRKLIIPVSYVDWLVWLFLCWLIDWLFDMFWLFLY